MNKDNMNRLEMILDKAREIFGDDAVTISTPFQEAQGYDSMALMQFLIELEGHFGVSLTEANISRDSTSLEVAEIIDRLER